MPPTFFISLQGICKDCLWHFYDDLTFVIVIRNFHLSVARIDDVGAKNATLVFFSRTKKHFCLFFKLSASFFCSKGSEMAFLWWLNLHNHSQKFSFLCCTYWRHDRQRKQHRVSVSCAFAFASKLMGGKHRKLRHSIEFRELLSVVQQSVCQVGSTDAPSGPQRPLSVCLWGVAEPVRDRRWSIFGSHRHWWRNVVSPLRAAVQNAVDSGTPLTPTEAKVQGGAISRQWCAPSSGKDVIRTDGMEPGTTVNSNLTLKLWPNFDP